MRNDRYVSVIVPALNEENAISNVIWDIPNWVDEIIVVDNGSTDKTAEVAASCGARVVREPVKGYGKACLAGINALSTCDIIVFLDGDYSDYPDEMHIIVDPLVSGEADLVIGSRTKGISQKGSITIQQKFGNWLACFLMRALWNADYSDLGPYRAIECESLKKLEMADTDYGWTIEMQIKAALHQLKVVERPVNYRARIGVSKISGTLTGSFRAGIKILRVIGSFALKYGTRVKTHTK